jgi:hypothetical protein
MRSTTFPSLHVEPVRPPSGRSDSASRPKAAAARTTAGPVGAITLMVDYYPPTEMTQMAMTGTGSDPQVTPTVQAEAFAVAAARTGLKVVIEPAAG